MQEIHPGPNVIEPNVQQRVTQPLGPPRRNWAAWIALGIVVGALIIAIGVVQAAYHKWKSASEALPAAHPVVTGAAPSPAELSNSFRAVAKAVEPAVVNVDIVETVQGGGGLLQFPGFPFGGPGGKAKKAATGSGFIVTSDGYILTNNHVVGKADKIDVTLADGRKFKGTRVGTDPETDLAVIKIDASGLPTAVLGDSDALEQGDWVLAIGSPFRLQQTLTAGIVSAKGRNIPGQQFDRFIQTDASINPGNSGGPLVDMQGEVIGINTLIFSETGVNAGIGFAIPSNLARQIYPELVKSGKVTRAYLGVFIRDLDAAAASGLKVDPKAGVLVERLSDPNGPAAKAGLQSGDVITAVDGKRVQTASELTDTVAAKPVGSKARIDFIREGKQQSATVTLAERPNGGIARATAPDEGDEGGGGGDTQTANKLGLTVQTVTPDIGRRLGLKTTTGAVVVSVQQGGPASEAGIRQGDVIHRIHQTVVRSAEDLTEAAKSLSTGEEVLVQIERQGQMGFATVTIE